MKRWKEKAALAVQAEVWFLSPPPHPPIFDQHITVHSLLTLWTFRPN